MKVNSVEPSFGMAIIINPSQEKEVNRYINRLPYEQAIQFSLAKMDQKYKSPPVILSLVKNFWGKTRLNVSVGLKDFKENFLCNPAETLQKGLKEANKIYEKQVAERELIKGMTIPRLD